ncbi:phosphate transport system regulatory protein PhoU [Candidatus Termititenax persephonae]|uniref:Phosphate-specific transport system accessory protein PhoU n=1 Tax=Candidatus Termititenax persephonae TaxID=2218525 RepID=A0A388THH3_9BACT|nr:phosphate transport system regulatory protein PhoU [Candidatus Termititenax persephonae]
MLAEKLLDLKKNLVAYAALVETMVADGLRGLLNRDEERLRRIQAEYEPQANRKEIELDEKCVSLLAQYQPKAKDLRTILMILGMNRDLERMGDHAVNIAQSALYLIERPAMEPPLDLPRLGEIVSGMLRDSIDAFVREDSALGKNVCGRDDEVDELRAQFLRELIVRMSSDASTIERALHIIRISGNLERIADLTTNIGEEVIFMVEGRVLKHHTGAN